MDPILKLALMFQEMESYLMASMARNLKKHQDWEKREGFEWTQWQAVQIQSLRQYRKESEKLVNETFKKASLEMEQLLTDAFHDGAKSFDRQISIADIRKPSPIEIAVPDKPNSQIVKISLPEPQLLKASDNTFFQINKPKLEAVINDIHKDMDVVRGAAINRMGSGYNDILKKADIAFQSGTMTLSQAVDQASRDFLAAGLNCVEYKNGRKVNISSYVEMALRASSRRAALTAEGAKRDEWGIYLVISPTLNSTCEACHKYQGVVMIDDVYASGKSDGVHILLSEAIKDNFLHPNCRHPLVTYFEGITKIPTNSPYDKTKQQYGAEVRQRQIELMIRQNKRLLAGSTDPANRLKYENKVNQWEQILKKHLKDNPQLREKPEREKIYA